MTFTIPASSDENEEWVGWIQPDRAFVRRNVLEVILGRVRIFSEYIHRLYLDACMHAWVTGAKAIRNERERQTHSFLAVADLMLGS